MCSGSEEFKSITRYGNHKQTNMAMVQIVFKKYWNKGPGRNIYTTILFIYEYNLYCVLSPQCFSNAFSHGLCVRVWGGGGTVKVKREVISMIHSCKRKWLRRIRKEVKFQT